MDLTQNEENNDVKFIMVNLADSRTRGSWAIDVVLSLRGERGYPNMFTIGNGRELRGGRSMVGMRSIGGFYTTKSETCRP